MTHIIELMGLPGSGKTTLCQELVPQLRREGIKALDRDKAVLVSCRRSISSDKSARNLINLCMLYLNRWLGTGSLYHVSNIQITAYHDFLFEKRELAGLVLENLNSCPVDDYDKSKVMDLFFRDFSSYQMIKRYIRDDEVVVLDEGFCQRAVSIWSRTNNGDQARSKKDQYLDLIPLPDVALVVDSAAQACENRLSERGSALILKNMNHEERIAKLNHIDNLIKDVALTLESKGVPVLIINNSSDIKTPVGDDIVRSIVRAVRATA